MSKTLNFNMIKRFNMTWHECPANLICQYVPLSNACKPPLYHFKVLHKIFLLPMMISPPLHVKIISLYFNLLLITTSNKIYLNLQTKSITSYFMLFLHIVLKLCADLKKSSSATQSKAPHNDKGHVCTVHAYIL